MVPCSNILHALGLTLCFAKESWSCLLAGTDAEDSVPEPSLGKRVVRGGMWVFGLRISSRLLRFVSLLVLARLLAPEDFGLLGITLLTIAVLEVFSTTGFQQALVQRKGNIEEFIDTAWTVHAIRGVVLYAILYFTSPLVASFFETPGVTPLVRVAGITLVLRGLSNIRLLYFQKELEFSREFIYQITVAAANVGVSIALAVIYRSVWALVLGMVAGNLTGLIVSYAMIPRLPRLKLNPVYFREMFAFGKWVFGSSILMFLVTQGDDAFVGKMLGATALGFYQLAYRISNLPATEITHVISRVTFPAYSKIQDDIPRLREAYLRVLQLTTFLAFPIAGMIFVFGGDFTRLFLGEKWLPMVPAMQILALAGLARSIQATTGPVFYGMKKPRIVTKFEAVRFAVLAAFIYPFTVHWGLFGTGFAVLLSICASNVLFDIVVVRTIECPPFKFVKTLAIPLVNASIAVSAVSIFKYNMQSSGLVAFCLLVAGTIALYTLLTWLAQRLLRYGLATTVRGLIRSDSGQTSIIDAEDV